MKSRKFLVPIEECEWMISENMGTYEQSTQTREELVDWISALGDVLENIPQREKDILMWYYVLGKTQTEISKMANIGQSGICARLRKALFRIKFLLMVPDIYESEFESALMRAGIGELDRKIVWLVYKTSCQSEAANFIGLPISKVRSKYKRVVEFLGEYVCRYPDDIDVADVFKAMSMVNNNLKILHEQTCQNRYREQQDATLVVN